MLQGKLKNKTSELARSLALAEAQERALKSNMSSAEATARGLKEQVQRMKTTVQQVRAQCANDIRKRDLEMQRLKSHLAERQRGKREGLSVTTININPGADRSQLRNSGGEQVNDPEYSLKQETTEFLTELCQNLSDENDQLIELARNTVQTLKEVQGLPQFEDAGGEEFSGMASVGPLKSTSGSATTLPTSCEDLSTRMEAVLEHLRTLLTNPSFVPLEEVEVRDEEIKRLRESWEKMENRWKLAVTMMDGWQRRLASGDSVQAEELKRGMNLDLVNSMQDTRMQDESDAQNISPILEDEQEEDTSDSEDRLPEPETSNQQTRSKIRKISVRPERALRERTDNAPKRLARKVSFTPGLQGSPSEHTGTEEETLEIKALKAASVTRRPSRLKTETKPSCEVREMHTTDDKDSYLYTLLKQVNPKDTRSIPQKLAGAEDDARTAEQSRRERESRKRSRPDKGSSRKGTRRRSTLDNDELNELMGRSAR